jgi:hypothetical protein
VPLSSLQIALLIFFLPFPLSFSLYFRVSLKAMEKQNGEKMEAKKVKILNTSSLQINQQEAFRLVGSIVEKGIDDDGVSQNKPNPFYSFPKPTVVPFPVARHRSHGPVSTPFFF